MKTGLFFINMNGPQTVLNRKDIIDHFRSSPVLFHSTGGGERLKNIALQGLTTVDFRNRKERIVPTQKTLVAEEVLPENPYDEDQMWSDLLDMESQIERAGRSMGKEYNYKYISLSFIPWWNKNGIESDKPLAKASHFVNKDGQLELGDVSIALDESESNRIIKKNCEELENPKPDDQFSQIINERTVAFAEALEPFRISPKHIAAMFLMEGKISEISNEVERNQFRHEVNELGLKFKIPIFNFYGDLLWPREMDNQDVLN